jgi:hypothetical protein
MDISLGLLIKKQETGHHEEREARRLRTVAAERLAARKLEKGKAE